MMQQCKVGTVTGTGAAINIQLGWVPDYVKVINYTDGDTIHEWFNGMTAGHAIKTDTAVAKITANGITAYEGTAAANSKGFTIGTDVSESADVLYYFAMRNP